jgi:protein-tyrosine kinase
MNVIEEAAKRLRQLEEAGIGISPQVRPLAAETKKRPTEPPRAQHRSIDLERLQAAGFITPALEDSKLVHEFRVIKRPLIQQATGKMATQAPNRNLVMVTSALPGEGKTFVALNLAMSLAMEVDCKVLLVDADVISPALPAVLGIEPAKGLMDLLTDPDTRFSDVLLGTNVERLTLLLAGTPHSGASELLASEAMTRLLAEVSSRYADRIVVFDSPPLLATTESRVLATHIGQVVLVVEAERTTHAALQSALSTVESCPAVFTLLNRAPESKVGAYYGTYAYSR